MTRMIKCPTCRRAHPYDQNSSFRPFCSERCRLIDLGAWSQESFRIPVSDELIEEHDLPNFEHES